MPMPADADAAAAAASARSADAVVETARGGDDAEKVDEEDDEEGDGGNVKLKVSNCVKKTPACVAGRSRHLLHVSHASNAPVESKMASLNLPLVGDRQYTKCPPSFGTVMR